MAYRSIRDREHRIQILQDETVMFEVWASKESVIGREFYAAQQAQSGATTKFETEYIGGVKRNMRVLCDDELFDIEFVNDIKGLKRDLLLMCKEVVL